MENSNESPALPTHDELLGTLKQCIDEVFSSMFITIDDASHSSDGAVDGDLVDIEVSVDFKGPVNGFVLLRCSGQGAEDIARGLLMMEEGEVLELEEVKDALGECGNMVTGALKSKALDPVSEFVMGLPAVRSVDEGLTQASDVATLVYTLSSGVMAAELWIEDDAA